MSNQQFKGKVISTGDIQSGISQQGNKWMKQTFVVEETEGEYPQSCVFTIFGEERIKKSCVITGEEIVVDYDLKAREYNGRYYNDVNAWRVTRPEVSESTSDMQDAMATTDALEREYPSLTGEQLGEKIPF